ncbi:MAG: hypothetical protein AABY22_09130, partial [Nanoarchaeota archaeon]
MNNFESLKKFIEREHEIARRINLLSENYERGGFAEKESIKTNIETLQNQLKTVNSFIPTLLKKIELSKPLNAEDKNLKILDKKEPVEKKAITSLEYENNEKHLEKQIIKRKKKDLRKKKYEGKTEKKPSFYTRMSNKLFSDFSEKLIKGGNFENVRESLIKAKLLFLINSYVSVILLTTLLTFFISFLIFIFLLFFNVSLLSPFITQFDGSLLLRFTKTFWIVILLPILIFIFMYFYPAMESGYLGKKIDEELPFLTIHLSAIAGSKIEPTQIFRILAYSEDYVFTRKEMISLINKINVYGYNIASALRDSAKKSPSAKLRDLFNGMATTINSGGNLEEFLNERSKSLL